MTRKIEIAGQGRHHKITPQSLRRERAVVRRFLFFFWLFVIGGTILAIYIATL